jgi:rhodanese-related sulfurtransferase
MGLLSNLFKPGNSISGQEVKDLRSDRNTVIIDVRSKEEYQGYHVPGSINIPVHVINEDKVKKYKDKNIIVYCLSGSRANSASKKLEKYGFNVKNMGAVSNYPKS